MKSIQFSVATPTRNSLEKLKRCIGSVRGQAKVVCEHLVQDANSSDGTPAWLVSQSDLEAVSESDEGMYDAINRAWARSKGQILSWLNSDEQYLPGTLAKVQAYFDANPQIDVVFGNYIVADLTGKPIALRREIPFRKKYVVNSFLNMQSATIFYRRHLWDSGILKLNSKYRYAADKDLILRIARNGVKIGHMQEYLSIFGVDGTNLSTHPRMQEEAESIRMEYGAYETKLIRKIILIGRRLERFMIGAYKNESIVYDYVTNEFPDYIRIEASNLGGRYSLDDIEGRADQVHEIKFK